MVYEASSTGMRFIPSDGSMIGIGLSLELGERVRLV
jgi:hypothetical protein